MFEAYFPAILMVLVAIGIATTMFVLASNLGTKVPSEEKLIPYESGSPTTGAQHIRLSVKFYLTAILFVVFDIEAIFLYPWASCFRDLGWVGLVEMVLFLGILGATLLYAWRKGALEWER
ncbi:MAG: NADH-quinone oxidoreductase subunit A [Sandaracinaceae bacterium]|nr:NADH-quinone oxidoreductase subunit A [Sandaracinaceae bacterium]